MTRVKICGITRLNDALLAADLGAHALGFIFYEDSKRFIEPVKAREIIRKLPPYVSAVGVFANETPGRILELMEYCGLDRVQIHSDNGTDYGVLDPRWTIMAHRVRDRRDIKRAMASRYFCLLDSYDEKLFGGTGAAFNWRLLATFTKPYILAGGINASNIVEALRLMPYAVDVASGVEKAPGVKDRKKLFEFFGKLRENQTP